MSLKWIIVLLVIIPILGVYLLSKDVNLFNPFSFFRKNNSCEAIESEHLGYFETETVVGTFSIKFPKDWSVEEEKSISNPDLARKVYLRNSPKRMLALRKFHAHENVAPIFRDWTSIKVDIWFYSDDAWGTLPIPGSANPGLYSSEHINLNGRQFNHFKPSFGKANADITYDEYYMNQDLGTGITFIRIAGDTVTISKEERECLLSQARRAIWSITLSQ